MADWQFKLKLGDVWESDDCVKVATAIVERGKVLVKEINDKAKKEPIIPLAKNLRLMARELENEVLPMFEEIVDEKDDSYDTFNYAMDTLYDWADTALDEFWGGKKMCWVETR